ncbi:MAG: tRNA (adenosine(37)-N6)-threonylcarbamoyltransferase complex transferase subunit TsaD [Actinomycetota bacterium]
MSELVVLGIETSCDDTAAAVVVGDEVRSSVIAGQLEIHDRFGGVVPELASRAHVEAIVATVRVALERAGLDPTQPGIDLVAATSGPGLIGSLLVGLSFAKAASAAWGVPYVGVNHLEAHLFAPTLEGVPEQYPRVVLLVSGGHTELVAVSARGEYEVLGATIDDAAGEAFDKVARYLGLGYPGGPAIDALAASGDPTAFTFPRALRDRPFAFSFSGLKTSVVRTVEKFPDAPTEDLCASFQRAVTDVLVDKTMAAVEAISAKSVALAGGVAANRELRERLLARCEAAGIDCALASPAFCTDNAAMVAAAGAFQFLRDGASKSDLAPDPSRELLRSTTQLG